ncbi:MAG TPA: MarR family transcriptional regulator [Candidatus Dormibacteraeota bacterium]|nr:MarR family transcriptional regulator [Candidatus Dormibacteraeota bacterium]
MQAAEAGETIQSLIFQVTRDVKLALEREVSSHGITAQHATLTRLLRHWQRRSKRAERERPNVPDGPAHPLAIAARLGTDGAGMTRLIDRLEKKGLVVRVTGEGDRRLVVVELTETGKAIAARSEPTFQLVNRRLLDGFSEAEVGQLRSLLGRLRANARKMYE